MRHSPLRLLASVCVVIICWFVASIVLGCSYAAIGPGVIALLVALIWGASGAAYSCLWELFERRVPVRYSGALIALITGVSGLMLFDDPSESRWMVVLGLFLFFVVPSYIVFYFVQSINRRWVLTNAA